MAFAVRLLRKDDDRSSFRSGDPDLDRFFAHYASQNQFRHKIAATHVADDDGRIVGYATVTAGIIETATLARLEGRKFPPYPLPLLKLARLASDERERGKGVGKGLLRHVLEMALRMSQQLGCVGVHTDAKAEARSFYERHEFVYLETSDVVDPTEEQATPMFLSMRKIEAALEVLALRHVLRPEALAVPRPRPGTSTATSTARSRTMVEALAATIIS